MDMSETIVAAMIGAAATVGAAVFNLFMAFRSRSKAESRPKRSGMRSMFSLVAIVLASAVAGFAYSELRAERIRQDTAELRTELNQQFASMSARFDQLRGQGPMSGVAGSPLVPVAARSTADGTGVAESMVRVDACRARPPAFGNDAIGCDADDAQRVALCANVPAGAGVREVQMYARPVGHVQLWEESRLVADQDAGGARFAGAPFEIAQGTAARAVCVNFAHWNAERGHDARVVVLFGPMLGPTPVQAVAQTPP